MNTVWVGDIMYGPTREGLLYPSTALDLSSSRCVGWVMRDTLETEGVLSPLQMTREARRRAPSLMFHSDRGRQYASAAHRTELEAHGMLASMSGRGNCNDNAAAESFFATLEFELAMRSDWNTRDEARRTIFRYIETWYYGRRRHSTLGYASPAEYEAQQQMAASFLSHTCPLSRGKLILRSDIASRLRRRMSEFVPRV